MAQQFYTVEEVAKILRVSEATVYALVNSGELKSTRVGRQVRISHEALQEYIERQSK